MQIEERLALLKKIENVAALAGLKGRIDPDGKEFQMTFATTEGRSQQVIIRPTGQTAEGLPILTMFSPVFVYQKGLFSGITKDQALELLRLNGTTFFARFGVWENDKETIIMSSIDILLESLDPEELRTQAWYVAFAADNYEAKKGVDKF